MLIESIIKREGGTSVSIDGEDYRFFANEHGAHVAQVTDPDHIQRFLSITEGYRIAKDSAETSSAAEDGADGLSDLSRLELATLYAERFGVAPSANLSRAKIITALRAQQAGDNADKTPIPPKA